MDALLSVTVVDEDGFDSEWGHHRPSEDQARDLRSLLLLIARAVHEAERKRSLKRRDER